MPKGIAAAVVIITLFSSVLLGDTIIPAMKTVLDLSFIFMIYTIILSTITIKFSHYFLESKVAKPVKKTKK